MHSISSNRKFEDEGTRHLAAALKNNKHVTLLKYVSCILFVSALIPSLSMYQLTINRMGHCSITNIGGRYLADMLKGNKTLIELL